MSGTTTTQALVIHRKGDLRLDDVESSAPQAGEVRIRIAWGGICGSDLHYLQHGGVGTSVLREPMVLGHEVCGTVECSGPGVTGFRPGEPVAVHPARPCGVCPECRRGTRHLCRDMRFLGSAARQPHTDGGFRRALTVDAKQLHRLPPDLDLNSASLAEPFAVALHAVERAGPVAGFKTLVLGAGPIGALIVAALRIAGAGKIVAADLQPFALSVASRLGAGETLNPAEQAPSDDFDLVFEATGAPPALATAIGATRKGGILVQVGMFAPGNVAVPIGSIVAREIDYRGSFRFDTEFKTALDLLAANPWIAEGLVSHRFALERYDEAFATCLNRRQTAKVLLDFS